MPAAANARSGCALLRVEHLGDGRKRAESHGGCAACANLPSQSWVEKAPFGFHMRCVVHTSEKRQWQLYGRLRRTLDSGSGDGSRFDESLHRVLAGRGTGLPCAHCHELITAAEVEYEMKIAQIAPLAEAVPPRLYGGTERIVSYLSEELVRQGHQVTVFYRRFREFPLVSISNDQRRPLLGANWVGTVYHGLPPELLTLHRIG